MDDKRVRVKEEHCDNEGDEVEILAGRDFGAEEATTTAAVGVKREGEEMIKTEKREFYEFGDGDAIVKDEDEENERAAGDERQSNETEKKYACDTCGKRFTKQSNLKIHEIIHTGKKLFNCGDCGKRFTQKAHLTQHLRIHTGETPYQCGHCPKRFKSSYELRQHERIRCSEKQHECPECGKRFGQLGHLRTHIRIHTGETPYQCRNCPKRFKSSFEFRQHERVHSGE